MKTKLKKTPPSAATVAEVDRKKREADSAQNLSPNPEESVEKSLVKTSQDEVRSKPQ